MLNRHIPAPGYAYSCFDKPCREARYRDMLAQLAQRWKPGASVRTHLLTASLLWSFIGAYLLVRGVLLYGDGALWWPLLALAVGAVKGRLLLASSARKNIARIMAFKDRENACLGAVYSLKMWGLVLLMMIASRVLREFGLPGPWVAMVYLAVGFALLLASGLFWVQWYRQRGHQRSPQENR